jgi:hypothetical protein
MSKMLAKILETKDASPFATQLKDLVALMSGDADSIKKQITSEPSFVGKCMIKLLFDYKDDLLVDDTKYAEFISEKL